VFKLVFYPGLECPNLSTLPCIWFWQWEAPHETSPHYLLAGQRFQLMITPALFTTVSMTCRESRSLQIACLTLDLTVALPSTYANCTCRLRLSVTEPERRTLVSVLLFVSIFFSHLLLHRTNLTTLDENRRSVATPPTTNIYHH
jgi:hypothetical protein